MRICAQNKRIVLGFGRFLCASDGGGTRSGTSWLGLGECVLLANVAKAPECEYGYAHKFNFAGCLYMFPPLPTRKWQLPTSVTTVWQGGSSGVADR